LSVGEVENLEVFIFTYEMKAGQIISMSNLVACQSELGYPTANISESVGRKQQTISK
jgi:hypothetical protein